MSGRVRAANDLGPGLWLVQMVVIPVRARRGGAAPASVGASTSTSTSTSTRLGGDPPRRATMTEQPVRSRTDSLSRAYALPQAYALSRAYSLTCVYALPPAHSLPRRRAGQSCTCMPGGAAPAGR